MTLVMTQLNRGSPLILGATFCALEMNALYGHVSLLAVEAIPGHTFHQVRQSVDEQSRPHRSSNTYLYFITVNLGLKSKNVEFIRTYNLTLVDIAR